MISADIEHEDFMGLLELTANKSLYEKINIDLNCMWKCSICTIILN